MGIAISMTTLVVDDYDRAIAFYCGALGLTLVADSDLGGGKRWVVVEGDGGGRLLLAQADGERQQAAIGRQTGGRVGFFIETDDFAATHAAMAAKGVDFVEAPRHETYGIVAVFTDLYGNRWDLIAPRP